MTQYILAGYFGLSDKELIVTEHLEDHCGLLNLSTDKKHFQFGIKSVMKQLSNLQIMPSEIGIDLLILAILVHAADTRLSRIKTSQDSWSREIKLIVPVSNLTIWSSTIGVLEKILNFLTGDFWKIAFRIRPEGFKNLVTKKGFASKPTFNGISLFSGGLDSLIGAIDMLETGINPLFVSHAGEGAVSGPQGKVFDTLADAYKDQGFIERLRFPATRFPRNIFPGISSENSTRGRSFLFFSLGACAGSGFGKPFDLRVPENGLIALNAPLDPTRLGSLSTRTTHPYYIHRWNDLLKLLGIPANVFNPYWNKTKGEMVVECKNQLFLKSIISLTVSCAHPSADRYHGGGNLHCGHCVPCIIRRSAINSAWGIKSDETNYRICDLGTRLLDSTKAEGIQVRAFQYAIEYIKKHPNAALMLIYKQGPLLEDNSIIEDLANIYIRGMREVASFLGNVKTGTLATKKDGSFA